MGINLGDAIIEISAGFDHFQDDARVRAKKQLTQLGNSLTPQAVAEFRAAGTKAGAAFNSAIDRGFGKAGSIVTGGVRKLGQATKLGIVAFGGLTAAGVAVGVKTAASLQNARVAFSTMLGSGKKADAFLRKLAKFAAATPFEFPELQEAASSLISAGINADKVIPIMTSLGNATSGMGTGSEGIKRATVALQQMNAAGRITGEDLNQLRDAGIPVFDLLAAATGKSKKEVAALAQAGKLGAADLAKLMGALETGKGLERFNGLMEKQSKTLGGAWSTLSDTVQMGLANALQPAVPILTDLANGAAALAQSGAPAIAGFIKDVIGAAPDIGKAFAAGSASGIATGLDSALGGSGAFIEPITSLIGLLQDLGAIVTGAVVPAFKTAGTFLPTVFDALAVGRDIIGWMADHMDVVRGGIIGITTAMVAWKGAVLATNIVLGVQAGIVAVQGAGGILAMIKATQMAKAASLAWTAVQWLLNVALSANPIGIVIVAVAAFVAIIVIAWKKSDTFRAIVMGAWAGIKIAISATVNWLTTVAWPAIKAVWDAIAGAATWLWVTILQPVFGFIGAYFTNMAMLVQAVWTNVLSPIFQLFGAIISTTWTLVIKPVLGWIGEKFVALGGVFQSIWTNVLKPIIGFFALQWKVTGLVIKAVYTGVIQPVIGFFITKWREARDVFGVVMGLFKLGWQSFSDSLRKVYDKNIKPLIDGLKTAWGALKTSFDIAVEGIKKGWANIQEYAKLPVKFVIQTVLNDGLIGGFNKLADIFHTKHIPNIPLPKGFREGGYTGRAPRNTFVGGVHGDEQVIRSESRRRAERSVPGGLDYLNDTGRWPGYRSGGRVWPTNTHRLSGNYAGHSGVDIAAGQGAPIYATEAGKIDYTGWGHGFGQAIFERFASGLKAVYGHTSKLLVHGGQSVGAGKLIGRVGSTGHASGPHLHFEVNSPGPFGNSADRAASLRYLNGANVAGSGGGGGGGGGSVLDPLALVKSMIAGPLGKLKEITGSPFGQIVAGVPKLIAQTMKDKALSIFGGAVGVAKSAAAGAWAPVLLTAMGMTGQPLHLLDNWIRQVKTESGGNPRAVQKIHDVNSGGNEARGLLQVIPPTFRAYRSHSLANNIFDPLANSYAAMNYAKHRYGLDSLERVIGHGHGYDSGGWLMPGTSLVHNRTGQPEPVFNPAQWATLERLTSAATSGRSGGGGDSYSFGDISIDVDDLEGLETIRDFVNMLKRQRADNRRTARSGTVTV